MPPLNPFLRAFFRSNLPSQCASASDFILLVPTTEFLLTFRDADSNTPYSELAAADDFLASHVLRLPGVLLPGSAKEAGNLRDSRAKAKQFTTLNNRSIVVKESLLFSNKGFKHLNQAQLLSDVLWYPDVLDAQAWLIYYISRPLIGSPEAIPIIPAVVPDAGAASRADEAKRSPAVGSPTSMEPKKEIHSFNELLNTFPMIARQMQNGLERLFREVSQSLGPSSANEAVTSPLSPAPLASALELDGSTAAGSARDSMASEVSNGHAKGPLDAVELPMDDEREGEMRTSLETAVTAAIDLFQLVDKQQLSLLGATTDLTGPMVERLIERYVTEQLHEPVLFPALCRLKRAEDQELERRIRQMEDVDVSQVGIAIHGGLAGKHELIQRLRKAVETFRRLAGAGSAQEMMEILLETARVVTMVSSGPEAGAARSMTEKPRSVMTMNADTLVSLLLVVVIRAQVRCLQARLTYMRHFIFLDDVEGGEMGYALSTFEAVLSYLAKDSGGLRKASRRNRALWQATRSGDVAAMKAILEPGEAILDGDGLVEEPETVSAEINGVDGNDTPTDGVGEAERTTVDDGEAGNDGELGGGDGPLPFRLRGHEITSAGEAMAVVRKKTVSMDTQSLSSSSTFSFQSRTTTLDSRGSEGGGGGIEGDTSIGKLADTQDATGESVLMMAVQRRQAGALRYLLSLEEYFPLRRVLDDADHEGTTLLSAAVQLGQADLIEIVLDSVLRAEDEATVERYLARQDERGRTAAHYFFNAPQLIARLGRLVAWRVKDGNGQTPLFALCRSYDHPHYRDMVEVALAAAAMTQADGEPLHLDEHVDGKGNTLLHILHEPALTMWVMERCDADVNATNDRRFTALMVASKYGRVETVRTLFGDARVDVWAREARGLTAVELAKDDEVRNRIDDLVLLADGFSVEGRRTAVVRSFLVEDGTMRLVLKSAAAASPSTITITTSRRSLEDLDGLVRWLALEQPASWLPALPEFRSAVQMASKPSRAVLREVQQRVDLFLKALLSHPSFGTHELVWEFFLAPEIQVEMMAERSVRKAAMRAERVEDEYAPLQELAEVEVFVGHARDSLRAVQQATRSVVRRSNALRLAGADVAEAAALASRALATVEFVPRSRLEAVARWTATLAPGETTALAAFFLEVQSGGATMAAMVAALARPGRLMAAMAAASKAIDRHMSSVRRSDRWPLGLLDETRNKMQREAAERVRASQRELMRLGSELRYTQQTVAGELAGWQDVHARTGRAALRRLAQRTLTAEKARLEGMRRAVRGVLGRDRGGGEGLEQGD